MNPCPIWSVNCRVPGSADGPAVDFQLLVAEHIRDGRGDLFRRELLFGERLIVVRNILDHARIRGRNKSV